MKELDYLDRFKFRIWDEKEQHYGEGTYEKSKYGEIISIVPPQSKDKDRFRIEQSSGKCSTNGDLIFENDILFNNDWLGNEHYHVVKWYQGNMVLFDLNGNVDGIVWDGINYQIVGNVHEIKSEGDLLILNGRILK